MNDADRGPWYLLTGVIIGLVLGTMFAWGVAPVNYVDTVPASLQTRFKDDYRALIAAAFAASGDVGRAQARISLLQDDNPAQILAMQAQRTLAQGGSLDEARSLGLLAAALGATSTPVPDTIRPSTTPTAPQPTQTATATLLPPTISPTITVTPVIHGLTNTPLPTATVTFTPTFPPTATPTPTHGAPYLVTNSQFLCDPQFQEPLLQVWVRDSADQPIPGVQISLISSNGQDTFTTGLKPEYDIGYADAKLIPGFAYTAQILSGSQIAEGIQAIQCTAQDGSPYWGSWILTFSQP